MLTDMSLICVYRWQRVTKQWTEVSAGSEGSVSLCLEIPPPGICRSSLSCTAESKTSPAVERPLQPLWAPSQPSPGEGHDQGAAGGPETEGDPDLGPALGTQQVTPGWAGGPPPTQGRGRACISTLRSQERCEAWSSGTLGRRK